MLNTNTHLADLAGHAREAENAAIQARKALLDAIRAEVQAGTPVVKIAAETGLSRQRVYQLLKKEN